MVLARSYDVTCAPARTALRSLTQPCP
jgi:hypothetical protein